MGFGERHVDRTAQLSVGRHRYRIGRHRDIEFGTYVADVEAHRPGRTVERFNGIFIVKSQVEGKRIAGLVIVAAEFRIIRTDIPGSQRHGEVIHNPARITDADSHIVGTEGIARNGIVTCDNALGTVEITEAEGETVVFVEVEITAYRMGSDALIVIGHHGVVGIAEAHPFFAEEVGCGIAEYSERIVVHCGSCHTHTGGAGVGAVKQ